MAIMAAATTIISAKTIMANDHRRRSAGSTPEHPASQLRQKRPALIAAGFFAFSMFVIFFAAPIFWNSLLARNSHDTIVEMKRGEDVLNSELRAALAGLGPAGGVHAASGDRLVDQATLSLALALRIPRDDPERSGLIAQTIELAEHRLRRAPADTHSWARLAMARYLNDGTGEAAISALRNSFRTGLYEYHALWPRLQLGVRMWSHLDDPMQLQTAAQGAALWRVSEERSHLVAFYDEMPPLAKARLIEALSAGPDASRFIEQVTQSPGR